MAKHEITTHPALDLYAFLNEVTAWSVDTFGPPNPHSYAGVTQHIRKELDEINNVEGRDVEEWTDVIILAFDGAMRAGFTPQQIADTWRAKAHKNTMRQWPDWRTAEKGQPIEHIREGE